MRRFVNAQVGCKDERVKSQNAPYMLILWTRQGECEIFVSLCNQRSTLNLSRICKLRRIVESRDYVCTDSTVVNIQDLEGYEQQGKADLEMSIAFPSQEVISLLAD